MYRLCSCGRRREAEEAEEAGERLLPVVEAVAVVVAAVLYSAAVVVVVLAAAVQRLPLVEAEPLFLLTIPVVESNLFSCSANFINQLAYSAGACFFYILGRSAAHLLHLTPRTAAHVEACGYFLVRSLTAVTSSP